MGGGRRGGRSLKEEEKVGGKEGRGRKGGKEEGGRSVRRRERRWGEKGEQEGQRGGERW